MLLMKTTGITNQMQKLQSNHVWGEFCRNNLGRALIQSFSRLTHLTSASQHAVNLFQARRAGTGIPPETTYEGKAIPCTHKKVLFTKTERTHATLFLSKNGKTLQRAASHVHINYMWILKISSVLWKGSATIFFNLKFRDFPQTLDWAA